MEDQRIIDEYHRLKSCRAVSELLGCSEETIRRVLIANNIPRTHWKANKPQQTGRGTRNKPLTQDEIAELISVYKETGNQETTAYKLGHSMKTVNKYVNAFGLGRGIGGNQDKQRKITDEQVIEAINSGLTRRQIADKYGIHIVTLDRRMHKLGVHPIAIETRHPKAHAIAETWHYSKAWDGIIKTQYSDRFEFVSFQRNRVRIKCLVCGKVIERSKSTLKYKNVVCEHCEEDKQLQEARRKMARFFNALAQARTPKICAACGGEFFSPYSNQKYCSSRCKHKGQVRKGSYRARCRKYGVFYDPSVNRTAVIKRDGGVCQICGKMCDPNDHRWGSSGPDYPTLDHIIALANGGAHTWGNVQCACGMCNSKKRDLHWEDVEQWVV